MADIKLKHVLETIHALFDDPSSSTDNTRLRIETIRNETLALLDKIDEEQEIAQEALLIER